MRVFKIHLVYGEDSEKSITTPLCVPILNNWFSVSVPADQLLEAADLTMSAFADRLAEMIQAIQDAAPSEDDDG